MTQTPGTTEPRLPESLGTWVAKQRWYAGKGSEPRLERIGGWSLETHDATISTHYILDRGIDAIRLYQVPLTERVAPLPGAIAIGIVDGFYIYDAPHDPAYAPAILDLVLSEGLAGETRGHRQPGTPPISISASAVLTGEQSNTSIICEVESGTPVILKIFRALHHGDNPDVILQSAIAGAGSLLVPTSVGYLTGEWRDSGRPNRVATGHLAFAQEFIPGAKDAWRLALENAVVGKDFSAEARALGEATAQVHATLAEALPTRQPTAGDIDEIIAGMRGRLDQALRDLPALEEYRALIENVFESARDATWPALQRIHGDYHLGQVLAAPGRGWVLVDFEGEPLRAMTERSEPDITLRDVAGMLRSFDYVAGSVALTSGGETPSEWASAARHGFIDGYIAGSGNDVRDHRELLDAFEIDKALYEAVYEVRNRPGWVGIPAAAIRRLAERRARL